MNNPARTAWLLSGHPVHPAALDRFLHRPVLTGPPSRADTSLLLRTLAQATTHVPAVMALSRAGQELPGATGALAEDMAEDMRRGVSLPAAIGAREATFGPRAGTLAQTYLRYLPAHTALAALARHTHVPTASTDHARARSLSAAAAVVAATVTALVAGMPTLLGTVALTAALAATASAASAWTARTHWGATALTRLPWRSHTPAAKSHSHLVVADLLDAGVPARAALTAAAQACPDRDLAAAFTTAARTVHREGLAHALTIAGLDGTLLTGLETAPEQAQALRAHAEQAPRTPTGSWPGRHAVALAALTWATALAAALTS